MVVVVRRRDAEILQAPTDLLVHLLDMVDLANSNTMVVWVVVRVFVQTPPDLPVELVH